MHVVTPQRLGRSSTSFFFKMRLYCPPLLAALAATVQAQSTSTTTTTDPRDLPITREGSTLLLAGSSWRAVGPNVYWLGLDENVVPPSAQQPFYAPLNASYPTRGRVTEMMATVAALGGTMIRAHTLGVSTGNPLSIWPDGSGVVNQEAFEAVDWAVAQARAYGLRLMVPLTDNYVSFRVVLDSDVGGKRKCAGPE